MPVKHTLVLPCPTTRLTRDNPDRRNVARPVTPVNGAAAIALLNYPTAVLGLLLYQSPQTTLPVAMAGDAEPQVGNLKPAIRRSRP